MLKKRRNLMKMLLSLITILIMTTSCTHMQRSSCACARAEGNCSHAEKHECEKHSAVDKDKSAEQKLGTEKACDDCKKADR